MKKLLLALVLACSLNGCASFLVTLPTGRSFNGTRYDVAGAIWTLPNPFFLIYLVDLPFTVAFDILFLPYTLFAPSRDLVAGPYGAVDVR